MTKRVIDTEGGEGYLAHLLGVEPAIPLPVTGVINYHLDKVEIFGRVEDAHDWSGNVQRTVVTGFPEGKTKIRQDTRMDGNTSDRRTSVILHFTSENGPENDFVLAISQHKGTEYIDFVYEQDYAKRSAPWRDKE